MVNPDSFSTLTAVNLPTSAGAVVTGAEVLDNQIQMARKESQNGDTLCK